MDMRGWLLAGCLLLLASPLLADERVELKDMTDKLSYSSGYKVGEYYRKQRIDMRTEMVMQGLQDAIQNVRPALTKGEMRVILQDPKKALAEEQAARAEQYRGEGRAFLQQNAGREGVEVLPSGLQYQVLAEGEGPSPQAGEKVVITYTGTRLDGTVFDSSPADGSPVLMELDRLIPGMIEGLKLMREGARWKLFIPADLAYGERGPLADQTLIFDLTLQRVLPAG